METALAQTTAEARNSLGYDFGLDFYGGQMSTAAQQVQPLSQMAVPAFWKGVQLIANDTAKLPVELSEHNVREDTYQPQYGSPRYRLVRDQPNVRQTGFEFWQQMVTDALIWGNAYAWVRRQAGRVSSLVPLLPDRTYFYDPYRYGTGLVYSEQGNRFEPYYQTTIAGELLYLFEYEVIHLRGPSWDGFNGINPAHSLRDAIGLSLARIDYPSRFFARGGRMGGILELPAEMPKPARDKVQEGFLKSYNTRNDAFETVILRDGARFHAAQGSLEQSQMVEASEQDLVAVANMLGLPASKLGANVNTSYNSLETEQRAYWQETLSHWSRKIEEQCWLKLLTPAERSAGRLRFRTQVDQLLWSDGNTLVDIAAKMVSGGLATQNESRKLLNLPPHPDGAELLTPSGMVSAADEPEPEPEPQNEPMPDEDRAARIILEDCQRRLDKRFGDVIARSIKKREDIPWNRLEDEARTALAGYHALTGNGDTEVTAIIERHQNGITPQAD